MAQDYVSSPLGESAVSYQERLHNVEGIAGRSEAFVRRSEQLCAEGWVFVGPGANLDGGRDP